MVAGKLWTVAEFISGPDNVLSLVDAQSPQFLVSGSKVYKIEALQEDQAENAKDIFFRGGPLDTGDRLD
ncbi:hypothetical protein CQ052_12970 [Ochrobactrum sp. MYb15]|uniref:hypothetical protein n=1 Tax=Brucella TaxID=234 RepID=UPI000CFCF199|nr:hypothetical protein [Brucella rhizosphaerae]PQZ50183.1 hypothetical protein CQZ90_06095 [Ochrobactrum sp. MYb19]PRA55150.1 hypothetical protein CQ062_09635 [Ochrobactrum sp. MYb68]PRA68225.1 hypothetical protein CQ053_01085 [Ochrobactrum sp. MYb18]PRA74548.1 hypothetical protein CQ049_14995 [Brucella thiophenivorans]PRA90475.1 hypothetical protein CQ051_10990 [Ochrobactrum sp. MYb14]PRA95926.1 hypothetical protein CQ052_12970 [Ochrobactrum sp. MYb15]